MSEESTTTKGRHGGRRTNAGRPAGTYNVLPYGAVQALRAASLRLPKDAPEAHREVAGYALERMVDVLSGAVSAAKANAVLKAATLVREELCGPIEKRVAVQGALSVNVVDPYAAPPEAFASEEEAA